jgi:hypothetical protein
MNPAPEDQEKEAGEASREQVVATVPNIEDDFGDESLGERQPGACSMEEACIVCQ